MAPSSRLYDWHSTRSKQASLPGCTPVKLNCRCNPYISAKAGGCPGASCTGSMYVYTNPSWQRTPHTYISFSSLLPPTALLPLYFNLLPSFLFCSLLLSLGMHQSFLYSSPVRSFARPVAVVRTLSSRRSLSCFDVSLFPLMLLYFKREPMSFPFSSYISSFASGLYSR